MTPAHAALTFVSLLVIVDPVALAPVFAALTRGMTPERVRRTAAVAVLAGFGLLAAAGLGGRVVMRAVGAEAAPAHLAAGVLLAGVGALMLSGRAGRAEAAPVRDPALVPLAAPLIAGPGALAAMVAFAGHDAGRPEALATLYALLLAVGAITYAAFLAAGPITRRLGERGVRAITRGLGAVLLVVTARFFYEGLRGYGLIGGGAAS